MEEQPSMIAPQKLCQHVLGLPLTALDIHSLQYGNDVLEQELGIVGTPPGSSVVAPLGV